MEELKKYIEDTLKDLDKSFLEGLQGININTSKEDLIKSSTLQNHLIGLRWAYQDILDKINNKE